MVRNVTSDPEPRFWAKVEKTADCWVWTGAVKETGYGCFIDHGNHMVRAHRFAYESMRGPIPEGLDLDHLCHVRDSSCAGGTSCLHRRCVNPSHLEPVTHRENLLRGLSPSADNARKTTCKNGHPYDIQNTYYKLNGGRSCRACHCEWARLRRLAEKEAPHGRVA